MSNDFEDETMARNIALWHAKSTLPRESHGETVVTGRGYESVDDAAARFSDVGWSQYVSAARTILDKHRGDLKRLQDEIYELKGELECALYAHAMD